MIKQNMTWKEAEKAYNVSPSPKKKGRKSLITPEALCFLLDLIDKNSQTTLDQMKKSLEDICQISTSTSSIARALADADVCWKVALPIPETWNTHVVNKKGRSLAGTPAKLELRAQGNRTTLIAGIAQTGIIHYTIIPHYNEGTKSSDFQNFLLKLAAKLPKKSMMLSMNFCLHTVLF
eukprot:c8885_g1_i2.p1 GENE.c8885_g1_i2~~c8885_g1_i2.p1  ORF type:complete len:178 (+),score=45.53 c8885_g1_i2:245-778(+)